MRNFRWCYIGAGSIAFTTAKELISDGGRIAYVWNRTKSKAEKFAKKFNCEVCENLDDVLSKDKIDGVYVNVIHPKHYDFTLKCLEKGIPVLCEKPITMNAKQAEEIFKAAKKYDTYLSEAMWTWHSPVAKKVKEWIDGNKIGKILEAKITFGFPITWINKNPRLTSSDLGGGVLLDLGIYPIRYAYELFGYPEKIDCKAIVKGSADVDDAILFTYKDFKVQIYTSFSKFRGETAIIKGADGIIKVPFFHFAHKATVKGKYNEKFKFDKKLYSTEFIETEKEILSGDIESKNVSIKGTIDVMKIMDECRAQNGVVYKEDLD